MLPIPQISALNFPLTFNFNNFSLSFSTSYLQFTPLFMLVFYYDSSLNLSGPCSFLFSKYFTGLSKSSALRHTISRNPSWKNSMEYTRSIPGSSRNSLRKKSTKVKKMEKKNPTKVGEQIQKSMARCVPFHCYNQLCLQV